MIWVSYACVDHQFVKSRSYCCWTKLHHL